MDEVQFKAELLDVLKDIGEYLAKDGDTKQITAKLDKPPKIAETQKAIKGAEAPPFKPGKDALVKNFVQKEEGFPGPEEEHLGDNETETMEGKEGTALKNGVLEDYQEEDNGDEGYPERSSGSGSSSSRSSRSSEGESDGDFEELRNLLKDIKSALVVKAESSKSSKTSESTSSKTSDVSKAIVDEIKKSLPTMINAETTRMLRKMGFSPSRPDVVKFGLDEDIKKSEDSADEKVKEVEKVVTDLSTKSWAELGRIREATGQFNAFSR